MTYRIYSRYARYDDRDAVIGCGYSEAHPNAFETVGLALAVRNKVLKQIVASYGDDSWGADEVDIVVLDHNGREWFRDPSRDPKPNVQHLVDDEIPF